MQSEFETINENTNLNLIKKELDGFFPEYLKITHMREFYKPRIDKTVSPERVYTHAQDSLKKIIALLNTKEEEYLAVLIIDERIQREKSKDDRQTNELIRMFKKEIFDFCKLSSGGEKQHSNWKDAFLNIDSSYQPISRTVLEQKYVYPNVQEPISLNNEERFQTSIKKNVCTISGSSFATDNKQRLENSLNEFGEPFAASVLDASYTASISNGWVMAVTDGCGHRENEIENEDIGRTSYFAAKNACRLMAGYSDADSLSNNLSELKEWVSMDLPVKVRAHRNLSLTPKRGEDLEKTTLACGRAFQMDNGNFRFVGFNIGDTMLIAYNPRTKTLETIAKARQIVRGFGSGSPAALPGLCSDDEMVTFDVTLPKGTIVFGLTDGVWDYLPIVQNSVEDQKESRRIESEIDFQSLMADDHFSLPRKVTVGRLSKAIADYSIKKTEQERLNRLGKANESKESEPTLIADLERLRTEGKGVYDKEVKTKSDQLSAAMKAQKVSVGDDYTLVGLLLSDNMDSTPDYTAGEIAASILTLGLYALIKDCLHIGTDDEVTIADGFGAAAATFGFFATGGLVGLGYLAYKGIRELASSNEAQTEDLSNNVI